MSTGFIVSVWGAGCHLAVGDDLNTGEHSEHARGQERGVGVAQA